MGRPKRAKPSERLTVYVDAEILQTVDILLINPTTQRIKQGARSLLVERLLREWVESQRRTAIQP